MLCDLCTIGQHKTTLRFQHKAPNIVNFKLETSILKAQRINSTSFPAACRPTHSIYTESQVARISLTSMSGAEGQQEQINVESAATLAPTGGSIGEDVGLQRDDDETTATMSSLERQEYGKTGTSPISTSIAPDQVLKEVRPPGVSGETSETLNNGGKAADGEGQDAAARAWDIEKEASEHLARRAAESPSGSQDIEDGGRGTAQSATVSKQPEVNSRMAVQAEYSTQSEMAPPRDITEAAGTELQTIMDQFENPSDSMGEKEIMSPRLERQNSILVLPPRISSLEHRNSLTLSPQSTGQSQRSVHGSTSPLGPVDHARKASLTDPAAEPGRSDETESIASTRAGSMFQPPPPSPDPEPSLPFDFHRFLEQLRHRTADPVARFLRSFLNEFGKKQWMVHEQVKIISDFLEFISKKMAQCEVWRTVSEAEFDNAKEGMEKLVMNRLYSQTFSPAIAPAPGSPRKGGKSLRSQADVASPHGPGRRGQHQEDVERDEVIAQKLRIYGWIQEEHLDINPVGDKGRKFLTLAQQELLKINSYRAPRDKIICVLNCCKVIFGFLKNAKSDQSADAFVPLLIYTVLQARPEHLVSNVQYIWRFRNQDKIGGEAGYYMSSLTGVVTFIENLDRTNLTISDEEFEQHVEQAVSAIAEKNKTDEYEDKAHPAVAAGPMQHLSEKSALSRPEVTPRNSMEAERSSPRRNVSQRLSEKSAQSSLLNDDDDTDGVTGLLRTIQKPLSSIGRIFSDDHSAQQQQTGLKPANTPMPTSSPRALSPTPKGESRPNMPPRPTAERKQSQQRASAEDAAARQASAEDAAAQRLRARENKVVVEYVKAAGGSCA